MIQLEKYYSPLMKCPLFQDITFTDIVRILENAKATVRTDPKNTILVKSKDPIHDLFIVLTGALKTVHDYEVSSDSLTQILEPGNCFGMAYCIKKRSSYPTLKTVTKSDTLVVNYKRLIEQAAEHEIIMWNLYNTTAERLILLSEKIDYMHIRSVREKICAYLLSHSERSDSNTLFLPLSRTDMAEYLGISRSAMTREMTKMQMEGLIRFDGRTVEIADVDRLISAERGR